MRAGRPVNIPIPRIAGVMFALSALGGAVSELRRTDSRFLVYRLYTSPSQPTAAGEAHETLQPKNKGPLSGTPSDEANLAC
jgi:hypothetical protein